METSPTEFDRRLLYRPFLERLNVLSSVRALADHDLIVPRGHDPLESAEPPIHIAFARAAELTRGIQLALVGGIGSGKTTEMWLTHKRLSRHADAINIFVDLAEYTDLSATNTGAILATAGLRLHGFLKKKLKKVPDEVTSARSKLATLAFGKTDWISEDAYYEDGDDFERAVPVRVPGLMRLRFPALWREVQEVRDLIKIIADPLLKDDSQITLLIDGLDRLSGDRFRSFAEQDLRALKEMKISIIIVAPLSLWYDKSRFLQEYFESVKYIPPASASREDITFLREILTRRGASELMGPARISAIVKASGGIIRDLLTLVRTAASYAYGADSDQVGAAHVKSAINQLGNRYLVGLSSKQIRLLRRIESGADVSVDDPSTLELLANRQILEHFHPGRESFSVHPALAKVLPQK